MASARILIATMSILGLPASPAHAGWVLDGTKSVLLHDKAGKSTSIGKVIFTPVGDHVAFRFQLNAAALKTYFLSMRDFKCLEGDEVTCYVPYPYANAGIIKNNDYTWLEHSLLFLTKSTREFGAKMENGIYFSMRLTDHGLVGTPQRIDLNVIASPPDDASLAPFSQVERTDEPAGARWIESISIEDEKPSAIQHP